MPVCRLTRRQAPDDAGEMSLTFQKLSYISPATRNYSSATHTKPHRLRQKPSHTILASTSHESRHSIHAAASPHNNRPPFAKRPAAPECRPRRRRPSSCGCRCCHPRRLRATTWASSRPQRPHRGWHRPLARCRPVRRAGRPSAGRSSCAAGVGQWWTFRTHFASRLGALAQL